jgi:hypothetical protein
MTFKTKYALGFAVLGLAFIATMAFAVAMVLS